MMQSTKLAVLAGAVAALMGLAGNAYAGVGLSGTWVTGGNGILDTGTDAVDLLGFSFIYKDPGVSGLSATPGFTYTTSVAGAGTVSFHWDATKTYFAPPDVFNIGYFLNGSENALWSDTGVNHNPGGAAGYQVLELLSGDTFGGFYQYAYGFDRANGPNQFGLSILSITEYQFVAAQIPTNDVPEPTSVALLGLGLVGLAALRKRKAA